MTEYETQENGACPVGQKVTAWEAGQLVNRHERVVRGHIKGGTLPAVKQGHSWRVDVDDLERIPGWRIDRARLALVQERDARTATTMAARIDTLEREVASLRGRLYALEARNAHQTRQGGDLTALDTLDAPLAISALEARPSAFHVSMAAPAPPPPLRMRHTSLGDAGQFDNRAMAARWLVGHGINSEGTPKSWPGWRDVEMSPRAVLELAQSLYDPRNHRITWRLHECTDASCVCHELLGAGSSVEVSRYE